MKKSDVLKEAKKLLWDGKGDYDCFTNDNKFICIVIRHSVEGVKLDLKSSILSDIKQEIEKCYTAEAYVAKRLNISVKRLYNLWTTEDFQRFRQILLDKMIYQYEKRGE